MMTYLFALLAVVALCAFWALFQVWLTRHDPDAGKRPLNCGACGCEDECEEKARQTGSG